MKLSNKSYALAFVVSLAAPLAFAQDTSTDATADASTQATTEATQTEPVTPVTEGSVPEEVVTEGSVDAGATEALSWNDVDLDQDGALSQAEAGAVPSLLEVFAQADADADGALTAEEYQSFVAQAEAGAGDAP